MRKTKAVIAIVMTGAFVALSASGASARWYHRGSGPVLGLVGGVVGAAAAVATLPFAVAGAVVDPGPRYAYGPPPRRYYGPDYPPPPPRGYYRRAYGPPPDGYYRN